MFDHDAVIVIERKRITPSISKHRVSLRQHFSLYATVENGGPLGLCQLHLAASLCDTPRGPQELRPQVARNGRLGSSSWRGRLNPRSCQLTLTAETASTASEGCARQQFLDALEVRKEVDGTVLAGCVVTGQRTVATRESGTGARLRVVNKRTARAGCGYRRFVLSLGRLKLGNSKFSSTLAQFWFVLS